ncbi:NAD(P)H pyrophosphatase NUDT13, mitochondrial-like [Coregonus clupeaformis]|uniref:NAD(P)H pyrophosphatase NUDT13, mitochondrial-like n=1 Tax=Coregonus clupeaformis TaxID=59861 RepID=UPI001E1C8B34|nr:NAD(P)H pyrophosphatase NUDT13, mitochondrial-like [Coregonus clupeaformis]
MPTDVEGILEKLGEDKEMVKESILINCTEQNKAQFSFDVEDRGFCSSTGLPTHRNQSGSQCVCHSSGIAYYPKMSPVVIVLVSDGKRCFLGRQSSFPQGMYSALAGFCDMGEPMDETLCKEIAEEVGLESIHLMYSGSPHWPFTQSAFMMACHATINPEKTQVSVDKVEDAQWFSLHEVQEALKIKEPPRNNKRKRSDSARCFEGG